MPLLNIQASAVLGLGAAALFGHAVVMRMRARHRRPIAAPPAPSEQLPVSPTFLFIYALCVAAFLEAAWPLTAAPARPWPWLLVGGIVALAAEVWMQAASRALKRHATTEDALEAASALIDEGPFARSRNPIYCGMLLLFSGLAIAGASLWAAICLPAVVLVLHRAIVLPEERDLARRFGPVYEPYRARVPRYL